MADSLLRVDLEIDRIVNEFEQALRRGELVQIEDYATRNSALGTRLTRELILTEIEFRRSRKLPIHWDEYSIRFPEIVPELRAHLSRVEIEGTETIRNFGKDSSVIDAPNEPPQVLEEPPLTPLDLSDYQFEHLLGGGGQGEVYLATQRSLGRQVAIKLLNKKSAHHRQSELRFLREARTLAQTSHPQIVTIHGIGRTAENELFLVMEHIEGHDLAKQIADRQFSVEEAIDITLKIGRAVQHAHSRGVIHRDLKPSNVLWHDIRGPVVTDFGLAKDLRIADGLTETEQSMGTPTYMAPEQAHRRFGEISERTDVYGLSATLYALLVGQPPIPPGPIAEVFQQLTNDEPITDPRRWRADLPPRLCNVCLKGLSKQPDSRFATIREFLIHLQQAQNGDSDQQLSSETFVVNRELPVASPRRRLEPGGQLGRFKLIAAISRDLSRKVFRAEDESGRPVLLKCLPSEWLSDRGKRSQFHQEVLLSCSLSHPCLATVIDAGTIEDTEFVALELLESESLSQRLARVGKLTEQQARDLLVPIAEAMQLIHDAGVIYRDLRPQNILLTTDDRPMLAEVRFSEELEPNDNVTMYGLGMVTSKYIAPELFLGRSSDIASDVYTLGATLYAAVTGREPFSSERDGINVMIAKNSARLEPPRNEVPELSDAICQLIDECIRANPAARPASAKQFAERLAKCGERSAVSHELKPPRSSDNLLHTVWDQLDADLQDAFSLAFNKKRRTGSTRISTRDLFEAMSRLGTGPLRDLFNQLPSGALPDPAPSDIPIDRTLLSSEPLLSDCVHDSLTEFRKLAARPSKLSPVDLFVDVAKHGEGASVVRLREHGVDPDAMERIVQRLGLKVVRRESVSHTVPNRSSRNEDASSNYLADENVQFSVYRPKVVPPETWQPLLAFAHLSEQPPGSPEEAPDPVAEVRRQAEQVLGERLAEFQNVMSDSSQSIPRSSLLTFIPSGDGLEFNPPQRTFAWQEPVHREEFRFKAASRLNQQTARGRLSVYLGRLLIAEVGIAIKVDASALQPLVNGETHGARFRKIFACVSPEDQALVAEFQTYARLLNDSFLMSHVGSKHSPQEVKQKIRSANLFQLYWSTNAIHSAEMENQWRYALSLGRSDFIRSLYWEEPFPTNPQRSLPPAELLELGFQKLPSRFETAPLSAVGSEPRKDRIQTKLSRVRPPRVHVDHDDCAMAPNSDDGDLLLPPMDGPPNGFTPSSSRHPGNDGGEVRSTPASTTSKVVRYEKVRSDATPRLSTKRSANSGIVVAAVLVVLLVIGLWFIWR